MSNELTLSRLTDKNIHTIRNQKVMLDRDVATALETDVKHLNENANDSKKWVYARECGLEPEYRFQLTAEEADYLRSINPTANISVKSRVLPWVYTRKGCAYFGTSMESNAACMQAVQLVEVFDKVKEATSLTSAADRAIAFTEIYLAELKEQRAIALAQEKEIQSLKQTAASNTQRVTQIEYSHNMSGNYYAVKGYASKKGVPVSEPLAATIGKAVSKYCRENNIEISKTTHHLYGAINTYHEDALAAVWPRFFEE